MERKTAAPDGAGGLFLVKGKVFPVWSGEGAGRRAAVRRRRGTEN